MANGVNEGLLLSGMHVLVVDDNEDEREMLTLVLCSRGARVTAVASAGEALSLLDRELPEVIVSDISLPKMDGYELMRRLRARDVARGGRVPAVAVTGWGARYDQGRAVASGFQVHLSKPVSLDTFVSTIATLAREVEMIDN